MKLQRLLLVIPALVLILLIANGLSKRSQDFGLVYPTTNKIDYFSNPNLSVTPINSKMTRQQVAQTAKSKPCLFIYSNKVYQIPLQFFDIHVGGSDELVQGCGTDITFSFNTVHYSSTAKELLNRFYYAELKD